MIIGMLSDTHDRIDRFKKIVEIFSERKVDLIIHCGDWKLAKSVVYFGDLLREFKLPSAISVFGNNDINKEDLTKASDKVDFSYEPVLDLDFDKRIIGVLHGDNKSKLASLISSNYYDLVCYGHTHSPLISQFSRTIIVNPGTILGRFPSVAIYDTVYNSAKIIYFSNHLNKDISV
jgi:putative phosphoesterase